MSGVAAVAVPRCHLRGPMPIDDREYKRILETLDRITAIDELAAYRGELRIRHRGDPRLSRIEQVIDLRMHAILNDAGGRGY